jgi:hypothetical protein
LIITFFETNASPKRLKEIFPRTPSGVKISP